MLKLELSYRGLITLGLALLGLWLLMRLWPVVLLILVALIFTAALLPYVAWLVRKGVHRVAAVLLILFAVLLFLGGVGALVVPAMIDEFTSLRDNLPEDAREFEEFAADLGFDSEGWDLPERAERIKWSELISGSVAVDYGQRVFFGIISLLTIIVLTAYLLIDMPRISEYLYRFVPAEHRTDADTIFEALGHVVGGYVRGQLITSGVIALYTLAVLLALGVDNAIAFAVLAGFADVIPLVGAFIATIPPVVAAFQDSPTTALIVLALLVIYQQFEDRILVPRIYGQTLNLPPLIVFIAVLAGGEVLGIPGILLALPAAAAGRVLLEFYLDRRSGRIEPPAPPVEVVAPDPPAASEAGPV